MKLLNPLPNMSPDQKIPYWIRYPIILGPPLLLMFLECLHPVPKAGQTPWQTISASNGWWLQLHILQLFLFCLLALSVLFLVASPISVTSALPLLCSLAVFLAFYSVLDAITGIASGLIVDTTTNLSKSIQIFGNKLIVIFLTHPVVGGGTFSAAAVLGGGAWLVSMCLLARLMMKEFQINVFVVGLLIASGVFFGLSHLPPTGPIGMLCYCIACILILNRQHQKFAKPALSNH